MERMKKMFCLFVGVVMGNAAFAQTIDAVISDMGRYLGTRIPYNTKVAVLSFHAKETGLSEYVSAELTTNLTRNPMLAVTPRRDLGAAQKAANFTTDAETTTAAAQDMGRRLGVQSVVFGSVLPAGAAYRLRVFAVTSQSGAELWAKDYTLENDAKLAGLTRPAPAPAAPAQAPAMPAMPVVPPGALQLDEVIQLAGKSVEGTVKQGAKLAVINFTSPSEAFTDYVIEEFTGALVMGRRFTIVDRRSLELIRKEMHLQLSGDVSDDSAQAIGRQLGAQAIVSGSLTNMGATYRFRIKVINVETTAIEAQFSFNLKNDAQTAFLLTGKTEAPIAAAPAAQPAPVPAPAPAAQPAPAPAPAARPAPAPATGDQSRPGLYVNGAFQGAMGLYDAVDHLAVNVKPNGNYVIVLGSDEKVSNINLSYQNQKVTITLKAAAGQKELTFDTRKPSYGMITIATGVTFIMEDGVALTGLSDNSQTLVEVKGGTFIMNGGILRNSKNTYSSFVGGGVFVESGTFTMNNGTIIGNTVGGDGGGVYVKGGTFTMHNGTISGNTATGSGGGVCVVSGVFTMQRGTFTMQGGTISGNTATYGGGVFVLSGTFTKSGTGGVIYGSNAPEGQANKAREAAAVYSSYGKRDTTARLSTALTTAQRGAAGGWE